MISVSSEIIRLAKFQCTFEFVRYSIYCPGVYFKILGLSE